MKKYLIIVLLIIPVLSQEHEVTIPLRFEFDLIKFHVEPLICKVFSFSSCTVCDINIPKEYYSEISKELCQKPFADIISNCCGEHPNSYIELSKIKGLSFDRFKIYFWSCNFSNGNFKVNDITYGINFSKEVATNFEMLFNKYGKAFYTKKGLDSLILSQKNSLKSLIPLAKHINGFDKTLLDTIEKAQQNNDSNVNANLKDKIDKLKFQAEKENITVVWDSINYKYDLIPIEFKNPIEINEIITGKELKEAIFFIENKQ